MKSVKPIGIIIGIVMCFLSSFTLWFSCAKEDKPDPGILVKIGEDAITINDVINKIPVGLTPEDSSALFVSIVDSWIRDKVLVDFAESRLYDLSSIEKKVSNYRDKLIVMEYLQRMRESHKPVVEESEVKAYYNSHKSELINDRPLVKGVFLMVNTTGTKKNEIRKLMSENSDENIDNLEKNWLDEAIRYEYFRERWVEWGKIADLFPCRFSDPDGFLQTNQYFEADIGDCSYFLQVTDYLPSGSEQPYEFAAEWIREIISQKELSEYEETLVETLIKKSIDEKKLETVAYNPISHEIITR